MAIGDILSVEALTGEAYPDGGHIGVVVDSFVPGVTWNLGSGSGSDLASDAFAAAKLELNITRPGFDSDGLTTTRLQRAVLTHPVRLAYPNQASDRQDANGGNARVHFWADREIYSSDVVTFDAEAGALVNAAGSSETSAAASGLSVTNSSTLGYPKVAASIDQFAGVGPGDRVKGDFVVAVRALAGYGIAAVKVVATGATSANVETVTVSSPTWRERPATGLYAEAYEATIPVADFDQGEDIEIVWSVYPKIGTASEVVTNAGNTTPKHLAVGRNEFSVICDKSDLLDVIKYVSTSGDDGANDGNSSGSPYATIAKAVNSGANVVYLMAGTHNLGSGLGRVDLGEWCVVQPAPGESSSTVAVKTSATTAYKSAWFQLRNVTVVRGTGNAWMDGENAGNALMFRDCVFDYDRDGASGTMLTGLAYRSLVCWCVNCSGDMGLANWNFGKTFSTNHMAYHFDGCEISETDSGQPSLKAWFGVVACRLTGYVAWSSNISGIVSAGGPEQDSVFWCWNYCTEFASTGSKVVDVGGFSTGALTQNFAMVGNVIEKLSGTSPAVALAADSSTELCRDYIVAHNTIAGERANLWYNDKGTAAAARYRCFFVGNALSDMNARKSDVFNHPTDGASGNRVGNWPAYNAVNWRHNHAGDWTTFQADYRGEDVTYGSSGSPADPGFVDDASLTGTGSGGGDYTPDSGSTLLNRYSAASVAEYVPEFDLFGNPNAGAIGAIQPVTATDADASIDAAAGLSVDMQRAVNLSASVDASADVSVLLQRVVDVSVSIDAAAGVAADGAGLASLDGSVDVDAAADLTVLIEKVLSMPTTNEWRGDARNVLHRVRVTVAELIDGALYRLVLKNVKTAELRATEEDSVSSIASRLAELVADGGDVFVESIEAESFVMRGVEPGVPIADGIAANNPAGSFVERVRPGRVPTCQEFLVTLPSMTSGGNWTLTANFAGSLETTGNITATATPSAVATSLNGLASASSAFSVTLEHSAPRTYRVKVGGAWAGKSIGLTASGAGLTGNGIVSIEKVQKVGQNAPAVWMVHSQSYDGNRSVIVSIDGVEHTTETPNLILSDFWESVGVVADQFVASEGSGTSGDWSVTCFAIRSDVSIEVRPNYSGAGATSAGASELQAFESSSPDEFQFVHSVGGVSRTYTFDGETTTAVTTTASLKSVLESLSNVDASAIVAHIPPLAVADLPCVVQWSGTMAKENQPLLTASVGQAPVAIADGGGLMNEIQQIVVIADGGSLTFSHDGNGPTASLNVGSAASAVDSAFEGLASIGAGGVTVTGSGTTGSPYLAEFDGTNAETVMALLTADGSGLLGGKKIVCSEAVPPVEGVNELQRVVLDPNVQSGSYRLLLSGQHSATIAHDSATSAIQTKLQAVSTVGASNAIIEGVSAEYLVEFVAGLGLRPVDKLEIDQDALVVSGASALIVETIDAATGATWWNNPANWTAGHVPRCGELVLLGSGRRDIRFGLVQAATCTFSGTDVTLSKAGDLTVNQTVRLKTSGAFPSAQTSAGAVVLSSSVDYWVVAVSDLVDQSGNVVQVVKLGLSEDGEPIEFLSAGTGTHRIGVALLALHSFGEFAGVVGWPRRNDSGDWIDRERYLQVDLIEPAAGVPNLEIGLGAGQGSALMNFDFGTSHIDGRILSTGAGTTGSGASLNILNDNRSESELLIAGGFVGIATESGELAKLKRFLSFAGRLWIGNVDYQRLEDYSETVEFVTATASGDVVNFRTR